MSAVAAFQAEGLFMDARWHKYKAVYDGQTHEPISVTTAIGSLHKGGLVPSAVRLTAEAAVNHLDIITETIASLGREPAVALLTKYHAAEWGHSASLGTSVHKLASAIVSGEAVDETEEERPYVDGFRAWLLATMPRIVASEQMVANLKEGYAGTFDLIAEMQGKRWLIDLKTTSKDNGKDPYPETGLQLAAYAKAEFIGKPNDPTKYPMPRCQRFAVLALRPGGYELVPYNVNGDTWEAFKAALTISKWMQGQSKTIIQRVP